ncbi:MAG: NUDIX domain-containing protein [Saprospiraceae bacterium]
MDNFDFYKGKNRVLLAVDCIIFGFDKSKIKLLVFQRKVDPEAGNWSLLGRFVESDESVINAATRVVEESTGLQDIYLEELRTYGAVDRDPGARVVSIAHYALIRIDESNLTSVEAFNAKWFDFDELPSLIFDHQQMVIDGMAKLRRKVRYRPIGFELLPEKFTIPQLKTLYEAILQKPLDRRNFRKKILSMDILEKLSEKDKSTSRKGAYLYRFNQHNYEALLKEGIHFEL